MKKIGILLLMFVIYSSATAQIGINTTDPNPNVVLDISSNNKGILIPRLENGVRLSYGDTSLTNGVIVYDSDMRKFFVWEEDKTGTIGRWQMINPWTFQKDKTGILDNMILTESIAETVKIEGNLEFNGTLKTDGHQGFTGTFDPNEAGMRIVVKNGIIIGAGSTIGLISAATTTPMETVTNGTVEYIQGTASPTWDIVKDNSYGNPDAFIVDIISGNPGTENINFIAQAAEFGETKFYLKEGANILDSIIMTATKPIGHLSILQNPMPTAGVPGEVTFTPGTGADEWEITIDQFYGNPDAISVYPNQGTTSISVTFSCDLLETVSTRFILKSGNITLRTLIVTSVGQ